MKSWILLAGLLSVSSTQGAEINIGGASAKYLYTTFSDRAEGVQSGEKKSFLGSRIETKNLYNIFECGLKNGWFFKSYSCRILNTQSEDLGHRNIISTGGDELDDVLAEMSREWNRAQVTSFSGISASVVYSALQKQSADKSYYTRSGQTRWLKKDFDGAGINEVYCQRTKRVITLLGEFSYKCIMPNIRSSDTNAPTVVLDSTTSSESEK